MKKIGRYLFLLIMIMVLWDLAVMRPIKLLSLYLHQLGHAMAAMIFSYSIGDFKIKFDDTSYTIVNSKGWLSEFAIANAGYLGSVLFALFIFHLKNTQFKKFLLGSIAIAFALVTIRYDSDPKALIYVAILQALVILLYMVQKDIFNDWLIDIIGISSIAYAIYDTFIYTIFRDINSEFRIFDSWREMHTETDTMILAKITHIPSILWGLIWVAGSLFLVYFFFQKTVKAESK